MGVPAGAQARGRADGLVEGAEPDGEQAVEGEHGGDHPDCLLAKSSLNCCFELSESGIDLGEAYVDLGESGIDLGESYVNLGDSRVEVVFGCEVVPWGVGDALHEYLRGFWAGCDGEFSVDL